MYGVPNNEHSLAVIEIGCFDFRMGFMLYIYIDLYRFIKIH